MNGNGSSISRMAWIAISHPTTIGTSARRRQPSKMTYSLAPVDFTEFAVARPLIRPQMQVYNNPMLFGAESTLTKGAR